MFISEFLHRFIDTLIQFLRMVGYRLDLALRQSLQRIN